MQSASAHLCAEGLTNKKGGFPMEFDEIISRKKEILSRPVRPIPAEKLEVERKLFYQRNKRSLELFEKAKNLIPGGVQHNLSQNKPFPLTMDRGKGWKVWDADGNEYTDYLMCGAPIMLGHGFDELNEKIIEIIRDKGPATGLTSEYELLASEEIIKHMPAVEMVRFLQSGTEADMAAIRIARGFTKKQKIIKIGGSYHGWSDQMVYSVHIPGSYNFEARGIPENVFSTSSMCRPMISRRWRQPLRTIRTKAASRRLLSNRSEASPALIRLILSGTKPSALFATAMSRCSSSMKWSPVSGSAWAARRNISTLCRI